MLKSSLLFLLIFSLINAYPQDTLRIMHYNLLNYGNYTSYCTSGNNPISAKDTYLKEIFQHVRPHIFTVNELGASITYAQRILNNSINVDGNTNYLHAVYSNHGTSNLVNMLFYDSEVLGLKTQDKITKDLNGNDLHRVIDIYQLYYKSTGLIYGDTIFLNVIVVHLKSGSSPANQLEREGETAALVSWLNLLPQGDNFLLAGDLNIYSDSEESYQNLVSNPNNSFRFNDPAQAGGNWSNDSTYTYLHTQSTRLYNTNNGCFSSGGMDDRFDFILANSFVRQDLARVKFIPGSYKVLGQDGQRLNQSLITPLNNSETDTLLNALYGMSDHLPVILKLRIDAEPLSILQKRKEKGSFTVNNPFTDILRITLHDFTDDSAEILLMDVLGREVESCKLDIYSDKMEVFLRPECPGGIYLLKVVAKGRNLSKVLIRR